MTIANVERASGIAGAERADLSRAGTEGGADSRELLKSMYGQRCACGRAATIVRRALDVTAFCCAKCAARA